MEGSYRGYLGSKLQYLQKAVQAINNGVWNQIWYWIDAFHFRLVYRLHFVVICLDVKK